MWKLSRQVGNLWGGPWGRAGWSAGGGESCYGGGDGWRGCSSSGKHEGSDPSRLYKATFLSWSAWLYILVTSTKCLHSSTGLVCDWITSCSRAKATPKMGHRIMVYSRGASSSCPWNWHAFKGKSFNRIQKYPRVLLTHFEIYKLFLMCDIKIVSVIITQWLSISPNKRWGLMDF